MGILGSSKKRMLLATLPGRMVDNLATQPLIRETALSQGMKAEDAAAMAAFFQEHLGFSILDEARMTRGDLKVLLTKTLALLRKGTLVYKKTGANYQFFSTVPVEQLGQEIAKLP